MDGRFNQDKQLGQNLLLIYSAFYTATADVVDDEPIVEDVSSKVKICFLVFQMISSFFFLHHILRHNI